MYGSECGCKSNFGFVVLVTGRKDSTFLDSNLFDSAFWIRPFVIRSHVQSPRQLLSSQLSRGHNRPKKTVAAQVWT